MSEIKVGYGFDLLSPRPSYPVLLEPNE